LSLPPSPLEVINLVQDRYGVHSLLVKFTSDAIDQSAVVPGFAATFPEAMVTVPNPT